MSPGTYSPSPARASEGMHHIVTFILAGALDSLPNATTPGIFGYLLCQILHFCCLEVPIRQIYTSRMYASRILHIRNQKMGAKSASVFNACSSTERFNSTTCVCAYLCECFGFRGCGWVTAHSVSARVPVCVHARACVLG